MTTVDRERALKALDAAFDNRIDRLSEVFVEGLEIGTPVAALLRRFSTGFVLTINSQEHLTAAVEDYFRSKTP